MPYFDVPLSLCLAPLSPNYSRQFIFSRRVNDTSQITRNNSICRGGREKEGGKKKFNLKCIDVVTETEDRELTKGKYTIVVVDVHRKNKFLRSLLKNPL